MLNVQPRETRVHVGVRVPKSKVGDLDRIASDTSGTRSDVLRAAIEEAIRQHRRRAARVGRAERKSTP